MKNRFLLLCLLLTAGTANVFAQDDAFKSFPSFSEMLKTAKKENKLLFIDCYFTGCHPCAQMDKEVFPNAVVAPLMEKGFVSTKVDVFKEKLGDTINMRYAVSGYPTFLILDGDGNLISREAGFKDAGMLTQLLEESTAKAKRKSFLKGFTIDDIMDYAPFYIARYTQKARTEAAAANQYIHSQKNWQDAKTAFAIFFCPKLDADVEAYFMQHAKDYYRLFGDELVQAKVDNILNSRMLAATKKQKDNAAFTEVLKTHEAFIPAANWKNCQQVLASNYYLSIAKDTLAYTAFMAENPVVYHYYINSFYSSLLASKRLTTEVCSQFCKWTSKVVNSDCAVDIILTTASLHQKAGDEESYKKYQQMALDRKKKYSM